MRRPKEQRPQDVVLRALVFTVTVGLIIAVMVHAMFGHSIAEISAVLLAWMMFAPTLLRKH